jgi:glycosyltransferase involved in cell wall biosynthesis
MISVCLACYNGEKYIKKQIVSILNNLNREDELIVSDDYSTDNTVSIIQSIQDVRIKIIFNKYHDDKFIFRKEYSGYHKVSKNFENALEAAQGTYIYLSDQDDIWDNDKINIMQEYFERYDIICHNYRVIDEEDKLVCKKYFSKIPIHTFFIMNILDNHFRGCCIAFKAKYLKEILPFPRYIIGHDYFISCLITAFFPYSHVVYIMDPLINYRRHSLSCSYNRKLNLFFKIEHRSLLFIQCIVRILIILIRKFLIIG